MRILEVKELLIEFLCEYLMKMDLKMDISKTINDFIIENFLFGEAQEISKDTNLLEKGIIDSTGVVELVSFIEDTFNIVIEDEELVAGNFSTLCNIEEFLIHKTNSNL